mmetsp:Transcript_39627/g.124557  ORF Transcript_39627/g.124557 Transcript_39627/m.124557 type:complete len:261 (+) Transcript_39627:1726-2508(+)
MPTQGSLNLKTLFSGLERRNHRVAGAMEPLSLGRVVPRVPVALARVVADSNRGWLYVGGIRKSEKRKVAVRRREERCRGGLWDDLDIFAVRWRDEDGCSRLAHELGVGAPDDAGRGSSSSRDHVDAGSDLPLRARLCGRARFDVPSLPTGAILACLTEGDALARVAHLHRRNVNLLPSFLPLIPVILSGIVANHDTRQGGLRGIRKDDLSFISECRQLVRSVANRWFLWRSCTIRPEGRDDAEEEEGKHYSNQHSPPPQP